MLPVSKLNSDLDISLNPSQSYCLYKTKLNQIQNGLNYCQYIILTTLILNQTTSDFL